MVLPDLEIMTGPTVQRHSGGRSPTVAKNRRWVCDVADSPVLSAQQTRFLVHVADGAEVAGDDLKFCILAHVVPRHLEHAQMEVRDRAEGPAGDEHDGCLLRVP